MKKTAILFAGGYEEVEALTVVDLLRRADVVCDIVALGDEREVTGSHGISVRADKAFRDTDFSVYDALILPGGLRGTARLAEDERVLELLQRFYHEKRLTAAICAAPTVLAKAGLLEGKKAVSHPSVADRLTGALPYDGPVAVDGTVITSRGLGTAIPFALTLVAFLVSADRAGEIAEAIVFD